MSIQLYDEKIIQNILDFLEAEFPAAIVEVNLAETDLVLKDLAKYEDQYVDPTQVNVFPLVAVWMTDKEENVRSRALSEQISLIRIMFHISGDLIQKRMYRYCNITESLIRQNPTMGLDIDGCVRVQEATIKNSKYYPAFSFNGLEEGSENGVCETFIIVKTEVERR